MRFSELHEMVPYAKGGKEKVLRFSPYPNITLAMPGRHALETTPIGGDFVVMVNDPTLTPSVDHQFKHNDIFDAIQAKRDMQPNPATFLMEDYLVVVQGEEIPTPKNWSTTLKGDYMNKTMDELTFLHAVQCLAVAEHRRYAKWEGQYGGRYLPFRFAAGIAEGLWTASDAANMQRRGRPGVEQLEKEKGLPILTKELMS